MIFFHFDSRDPIETAEHGVLRQRYVETRNQLAQMKDDNDNLKERDLLTIYI